MFSVAKIYEKANLTDEACDGQLSFMFNYLAPLRKHRMSLLPQDVKGQRRASCTLEQIRSAAIQMLEHSKNYRDQRMVGLVGRRTKVGNRSAADNHRGDLMVAEMLLNRESQTRRVDFTAEEWLERERSQAAAQSKYEFVLEAVQAVTDCDRQRSVIFEVKYEGQVCRTTMYLTGLGVKDGALARVFRRTRPFFIHLGFLASILHLCALLTLLSLGELMLGSFTAWPHLREAKIMQATGCIKPFAVRVTRCSFRDPAGFRTALSSEGMGDCTSTNVPFAQFAGSIT